MKYFSISIAFLFLTTACSSTPSSRAPASVNRPPQFVLLAFDGSKSLNMWKETRAFAKEQDIQFTYFISGVYFLSKADRRQYIEPRHGAGKSAIGFGKGEMDISHRFRQVRDAINEGHEIASHANAHYSGDTYKVGKRTIPAFTEDQWLLELDQFKGLMNSGVSRYNVGGMPQGWNGYIDNTLEGFRAPQLGRNPQMFRALKRRNYSYDTSDVGKMAYWPEKKGGVWRFPLAGIRTSRTNKKILSMDYNFYVADSKGEKGPAADWKFYEDQMFETYINYFKHNYFGNRAPLDIGHHFSKWNGGAYWNAMKRFAKTVCHQPEVKCVTYSELRSFMESLGSRQRAELQAGNFTGVERDSVNLPQVLQRTSTTMQELDEDELDELRKIRMDMKHEDVDNSTIDI